MMSLAPPALLFLLVKFGFVGSLESDSMCCVSCTRLLRVPLLQILQGCRFSARSLFRVDSVGMALPFYLFVRVA